jgi:hypothetical protein
VELYLHIRCSDCALTLSVVKEVPALVFAKTQALATCSGGLATRHTAPQSLQRHTISVDRTLVFGSGLPHIGQEEQVSAGIDLDKARGKPDRWPPLSIRVRQP